MQDRLNTKVGVLLVNLGTPDSSGKRDVRRYLKEFLSDPRVIEAPRFIWWFALNIVILNLRPRIAARAYQSVWTEDGSPLLSISKDQQKALQKKFDSLHPGKVSVFLAMRYGNPAIADELNKIRQQGIERILVVPMYPQYSATTTASVFDGIAMAAKNLRHIPEFRFINRYFTESTYIDSLASSVREFQQAHGKPEKLVMSFHGLPKEYCEKGDPYHDECRCTAAQLAAALELGPDDWMLTFQSRVGPKEWLQPYTDKSLQQLASDGIRHVQVICPGFAADCLETLEEVAVENRDYFIEAGGEKYEYIPCLNDRDDHIDMLAGLATRHSGGWL
ncbi:MAG: ferrochelatase [bacterium]